MFGEGASISIRFLALSLGGWLLAAHAVEASDERFLQPVENTAGWVLRVEEGSVSAERAGQRARFRLRRGETLDVVAEAGTGWVAAGGRENDFGGRRLVLLASDGFASRRLSAPAVEPDSIGLRPVLFVDHGELVGMAWLEGNDPRRLEVRAALREGEGWSVTETVAGPAAGSQTALSGAVLLDGSWLLVWSAFDGKDDEIQWSRRSGGAWSTPKRLHASNSVPDVTPAVVATDGGALVAWSRLVDGEYATVIARLEGERWGAAQQVTGPGAFYPSFHRDARATHLLLRSAQPRGWTVLDLAADGKPHRQAVFATPDSARPAVDSDNGRSLTLNWAGDPARETATWEKPE